ncbi:hypothetical protein D3C81_688000 [compost metagenome]
MKKEGNKFKFELAIIKSHEEIELKDVEVFAKSLRAGRLFIRQEYPDADIYNHQCL